MIQNWQIPLLMTFLAGLATILGGFITFFVNKNNKIITFKLPASSLNLNKAEALIENMDTHIAKSFKLKFFLKVDLEEFAY